MEINSNFVLVKKLEEPKAEGFQAVEIQDNFVYKGKVHRVPACPVYVDNHAVAVGEVVIFAKYSPDTVEIDFEGEKMKFVKVTDLLAVLK